MQFNHQIGIKNRICLIQCPEGWSLINWDDYQEVLQGDSFRLNLTHTQQAWLRISARTVCSHGMACTLLVWQNIWNSQELSSGLVRASEQLHTGKKKKKEKKKASVDLENWNFSKALSYLLWENSVRTIRGFPRGKTRARIWGKHSIPAPVFKGSSQTLKNQSSSPASVCMPVTWGTVKACCWAPPSDLDLGLGWAWKITFITSSQVTVMLRLLGPGPHFEDQPTKEMGKRRWYYDTSCQSIYILMKC